MTEQRQVDRAELADVVGSRRGLDVYGSNPSMRIKGIPTRQKQVVVAEGARTLFIGKGTGEVFESQALYVENRAVDRERFVKVYPELVRKLKDLSNPAREVFEVAYMQMLNKHQEDKIGLVPSSETNG